MKKIFLMVIAITTIACSCKKYEDGPCISFRSAKNRLFGSYHLVSYAVNGNDSLKLYSDSLGLHFSFYYEEIPNQDLCKINGKRNDGGESEVDFNWELVENNKKIRQILSTGWSYGTGPFGKNKNNIEWTIIRLTNKEVKLSTFYNSQEYKVDLMEVQKD